MGGYLRPNQIEELENERRVLKNTLKSREVQERGNLESQVRRLEHQIEAQSPPDTTPAERDALAREAREIEAHLLDGIPSAEEMRKNPPGTVGRHIRWEKKAKARSERWADGPLRRWKEIQLTLNKGDFDPDVANFERLRPVRNPLTSMEGAQIPGQTYVGLYPSEGYIRGWERVFGGKPGGQVEIPVETSLDSEIPVEAAPKKSMHIETKCGRKMDKRGVPRHEKFCKACQEA